MTVKPEHRKAVGRLLQRLRASRTDFPTFLETAVRDKNGRVLDLAPFHRQWIAHVEYCWARGLKAILIAPFAHGKTSSFAVPLMTWVLGQNPNNRVKLITAADEAATQRVGLAKQIIEGAAFQYIFPSARRGEKWTDHELYLRRKGLAVDPSLQARGIFTKGLGGRADYILFDDVVDQLNSADVEQRKKTLSFVEETWLSRLEPDGKALYVGTPWHLDDATHHLMQRPGWCSLIQRVLPGEGFVHDMELVGAQGDYRWVTDESAGRVAS